MTVPGVRLTEEALNTCQEPGAWGKRDTWTLNACASLLSVLTWNYEGEGLASSQASPSPVPTRLLTSSQPSAHTVLEHSHLNCSNWFLAAVYSCLTIPA